MSRYLGKVALITGGGQGLGKAFASALLDRGAKVSLVDINKKIGLETEKQFKTQHGDDRALFLPCDVTNQTQLQGGWTLNECLVTYGTLIGNIVINNAGIADEINWEKTIAVDLNAVIHGTYLGVKAMRNDDGGHGGVIINISSLAGMVATPAGPAYTAAKHGVLGFTRSLAQTVPGEVYGIRLCCLCPSFANTEIMQNIFDAEQLLPTEWQQGSRDIKSGAKALGMMKPEDVVVGLLTLLEEDRSHGAVLTITPVGMEYKAPKHLKGKL